MQQGQVREALRLFEKTEEYEDSQAKAKICLQILQDARQAEAAAQHKTDQQEKVQKLQADIQNAEQRLDKAKKGLKRIKTNKAFLFLSLIVGLVLFVGGLGFLSSSYLSSKGAVFLVLTVCFVGIGLWVFGAVFYYTRAKGTARYARELGVQPNKAALQKVVQEAQTRIPELKNQLEAARQELQGL